jgi:hypothetical protein
MSLTSAERLLQQLGITDPGEIDLEAIAFHLGARVKFRRLEGCEARIIGCNDVAIITISDRCSCRRQRFSLAHEIGHWTHHKGRTLVCRVEESLPQSRMSPERVANDFAADLLMPSYIFGPVARSFRKLNFKTVSEVAEVFDASLTATAIRLVESGHAPALLVCHGLTGRKWFTRGPDVPSRWYPRLDLDAQSFAFEALHSTKPDYPAPQKIGADAWFDRPEAERYEVQEQTIRTRDGEVLTLVIIQDPRMLEERDR